MTNVSSGVLWSVYHLVKLLYMSSVISSYLLIVHTHIWADNAELYTFEIPKIYKLQPTSYSDGYINISYPISNNYNILLRSYLQINQIQIIKTYFSLIYNTYHTRWEITLFLLSTILQLLHFINTSKVSLRIKYYTIVMLFLFNDGLIGLLHLRTETIAILRRVRNGFDDYDVQMG